MDRADFDLSSSQDSDDLKDHSPRHRRLLGVLALSILLAGVTSSLLGGLAWSSYVRDQTSRTFVSTATTAAGALSIALQRDADLTATARTLIETTPNLSLEPPKFSGRASLFIATIRGKCPLCWEDVTRESKHQPTTERHHSGADTILQSNSAEDGF